MFVSISRKCEFLSHFKSDYHDTTENEKEELLTTEKLPDRKLKKKISEVIKQQRKYHLTCKM